MTIFCTCCSSHKAPDDGYLPAILRYCSGRINSVFFAASAVQVAFRILSAEFGLIAADHPTPRYNHLLLDSEVPQLAVAVSAQIQQVGATQLVYFTRPFTELQLKPYFTNGRQRIGCQSGLHSAAR